MSISEITVLCVMVAGYGIFFSWIIAGYFRNIARMKGHNEERYFWVPFVFTIAGYFLVVALPDRNRETTPNKPMYDTDMTETTT